MVLHICNSSWQNIKKSQIDSIRMLPSAMSLVYNVYHKNEKNINYLNISLCLDFVISVLL